MMDVVVLLGDIDKVENSEGADRATAFIGIATVDTLLKPTVLRAGDSTAWAKAEVAWLDVIGTVFPFVDKVSISWMGESKTWE